MVLCITLAAPTFTLPIISLLKQRQRRATSRPRGGGGRAGGAGPAPAPTAMSRICLAVLVFLENVFLARTQRGESYTRGPLYQTRNIKRGTRRPRATGAPVPGASLCDLRGLGPKSKVPASQRDILSLPGSNIVKMLPHLLAWSPCWRGSHGSCFSDGINSVLFEALASKERLLVIVQQASRVGVLGENIVRQAAMSVSHLSA